MNHVDSEHVSAVADEWWLHAAEYDLLDSIAKEHLAPGRDASAVSSDPVSRASAVAVLIGHGLVEKRDGCLRATEAGLAELREYVVASGMAADDLRLWTLFNAVRDGLDRNLSREIMRSAEVTTAEFDVLRVFLHSPLRMLRVGDLADALGWEQSRVSHQVSRMAKRGMLRAAKPNGSTDRRTRWFEATAQGRAAALTVMPRRAVLLREIFFSAFEDDDRERFGALLARCLARIRTSDKSAAGG